jgi:hypothetical protein
MRESLYPCLLINGVNGGAIVAITLGEVRDIVAILLGFVSIVSTILVIAMNFRKLRKGKDEV